MGRLTGRVEIGGGGRHLRCGRDYMAQTTFLDRRGGGGGGGGQARGAKGVSGHVTSYGSIIENSDKMPKSQ